MCSTEGAHFMKQYLPNKYHKLGFKLFVLCSVSEYAYSFEIHSGKQDVDNLSYEPDVGVVGNTVPINSMKNEPYPIFQRFLCMHSSTVLLIDSKNIYIQRNRLGKNCKLIGCKGFSQLSIKCIFALCDNKNRNYFTLFHS
ncbi:DDE_Tnp_1_7 domain-containing protein [Trichonephila inaurata madagascariensis]|uniref:DDE_Tnp_1_7 domain-containing protein n=1 Tax=Trichonephila inaurata madagascariensis TaxID=2747483 RepID=A0A8X6Y9J2_9ARAC|nr:DDE_Tnp_1_7 domain-containing protein [Trichonephila inaurata madagascariensis]